MVDHGVGRHSPAVAVPAEQVGTAGVRLRAGERGCHRRGRYRLRIDPRPAFFLEREVVAQGRDADPGKGFGDARHAAVAHVGTSPVAEGQGPAMLALGRQKQRADPFLADVDVQFVHQSGRSAAELITVPTSPYSTDSSTLIQ